MKVRIQNGGEKASEEIETVEIRILFKELHS